MAPLEQPDSTPPNDARTPPDSSRMAIRDHRAYLDRTTIETVLLSSIVGLMMIMYFAQTASFAVLNLFFLPVTLAAFFLGRFYACNTAVFCFLTGVVACWWDASLSTWLSLSIWGAVLGLQALVIGTLSDDHHREVFRLREMHRTDTLSDALTHVANRRAFEYELARRITEWHRQRTPLTLILMDIDHFKQLNDTHGHPAGDLVLQQVAGLIQEDCRETDLVARYGGEEFAVVMPNTPRDEAMKVAERVRCSVESHRFSIGKGSVKLTISLGLAQVQRGEERASLVQRADMALYTSKQEGRNCSHFNNGQQCDPFGASAPRGRSRERRSSERSKAPFADLVTGLPTRRVYVDELRRRLAEANRYDLSLSVMLVQIDDRSPSDSRTDAQRDRIGMMVADHARTIVRDADLVANFDDDQLAILCPATRLEEAVIPAERLRDRVAQSRGFVKGLDATEVTISVGLTAFKKGDSVGSILQRAETALWKSVRDGGNNVVVTTPEEDPDTQSTDPIDVVISDSLPVVPTLPDVTPPNSVQQG